MPGLEDSRAKILEVDVLAVGVLDQVVKRWIVEDGPPVAEVDGMTLHAGIGRIDPARRNCGLGAAIVRPHLEALVHVVGKARASSQAKHTGDKERNVDLLFGLRHGGLGVRLITSVSVVTIDRTGVNVKRETARAEIR